MDEYSIREDLDEEGIDQGLRIYDYRDGITIRDGEFDTISISEDELLEFYQAVKSIVKARGMPDLLQRDIELLLSDIEELREGKSLPETRLIEWRQMVLKWMEALQCP